ncbi:hypothetical protein L195_g052353, partial [Trifolium pratense]
MDSRRQAFLRKYGEEHFTVAVKVLGSSGVAHTMKRPCIKSFPKGTWCGRDGMRAQHLLDALCGEGSAVARDLTPVVNMWLGGRCSNILSEFVASAPLTPLLKPNGGICPIAVGTIWRRL